MNLLHILDVSCEPHSGYLDMCSSEGKLNKQLEFLWRPWKFIVLEVLDVDPLSFSS